MTLGSLGQRTHLENPGLAHWNECSFFLGATAPFIQPGLNHRPMAHTQIDIQDSSLCSVGPHSTGRRLSRVARQVPSLEEADLGYRDERQKARRTLPSPWAGLPA